MKLHNLVIVIVSATLLAVLLAVAPLVRDASAQNKPDKSHGQAVYHYWCAPCHAAGPGHPGTQSLEIKYSGSLPAVLEERKDLTPALVQTTVRQGILLMAPFRKTEISNADLEAIAAYLSK